MLLHFTVYRLPWLSLGLTSASLLPFPSYVLLGNEGRAIFAPLAGICVVMATGLVWCMWGVLSTLLWVLGKVKRLSKPETERNSTWRCVIVVKLTTGIFLNRPPSFSSEKIPYMVLVGSIALPLLLVVWVVPFQAIYFVLFLRHLWRCSGAILPPLSTSVRRRPGWKVSDDIVSRLSFMYDSVVG